MANDNNITVLDKPQGKSVFSNHKQELIFGGVVFAIEVLLIIFTVYFLTY